MMLPVGSYNGSKTFSSGLGGSALPSAGPQFAGQHQMGLFIIVAAGIGLLFALAAFVWKSRPLRISAIVWLAYAAYEATLYLRLLCSGECNIRIDLLLIFPALLFVSLWSIIAAVRSRHI